MLYTALFNAVYLHNAYLLLAIYFCKCALFSYIVLGLLTNSLLTSLIIVHHVKHCLGL